MRQFYQVIGQAGIFLICAQAIVHFRPRESYDKYMKLLLSVMLLLQLICPVLGMLGENGVLPADRQVEEFTAGLQEVLERAGAYGERTAERADEIRMEETQELQPPVETEGEADTIKIRIEPVTWQNDGEEAAYEGGE